jgi:hypothetical protein
LPGICRPRSTVDQLSFCISCHNSVATLSRSWKRISPFSHIWQARFTASAKVKLIVNPSYLVENVHAPSLNAKLKYHILCFIATPFLIFLWQLFDNIIFEKYNLIKYKLLYYYQSAFSKIIF